MTDPRFAVIDLETTSRETKDAQIVEWALVLVTPEFFGDGGISAPLSGLVRPPIPIPPETSAIHHIIDSDVTDAPAWDIASKTIRDALVVAGTIAVAHNAQYEREILEKTFPGVAWLCTYKAALRVWPEAPSHSNESLRYYLGLGTNRGRKSNQSPHSAAHDAVVTAQLLCALLGKASLDDMLRWTKEPALLPTCPIGDWRGYKWPDVDLGFLLWILKKAGTMREDVVFCARTEIDRREAERRAEIQNRAPADDSDIPF